MLQRAFCEAERVECHSEAVFGDKHPLRSLFNDGTNTREKLFSYNEIRLHKIKCKTRCSPEENLLPQLSFLPVKAHIFDFLLMPLRRDPNYPSAVKHLFLHSHGPAARLRPGKPLGMSLVTLSCHCYTDHPSLPFVKKTRLSMVPVWKNLFSLFCDKCEGHYLCHGQQY